MPNTQEDPPSATVPFYVLTLTSDIAAIKTLCSAIPKIEKELDDLRANSVPMREHEALLKRTETLWDNYQRVKGVLWVLGAVQILVATALGGRIAHIIP